ncbi:replication-associated protein [Capybara virus 26_cap1_2125]|nr:replication-associated protein [Capybara virus 26_cap1_2125]
MTFRMNAKNYFLTYPQCEVAKEDMLAAFLEKEGDRIKWMVVAHELHKDGGDHLHVQVEYERPRNVRKEDYFDFHGCHPNIQATRRIKVFVDFYYVIYSNILTYDVAEYVRKDGDYVLHGVTEEEFKELLARGGAKISAYAEVVSSTSYEEALAAVKRVDPRSWVNNGDRIRDNLKFDYTERFPEYLLFECTPPEECLLWLANEFPKKSRAKCLFLIGDSKLGKTHWARSVAHPHVYWKNMVNLDNWNPEAKLLIFDDFDKWEFVPNPKGYLTQAGECVVTDKYKKKRTIVVNMPAMFLANEMPFIGGVPLCDVKYWKDNGEFVRVYDKFY